MNIYLKYVYISSSAVLKKTQGINSETIQGYNSDNG